MLRVTAGFDRRDATSLRDVPPDFMAALDGEVKGLKVAWSSDLGYAVVDQQVLSSYFSCLPVFESLGCAVEEKTPNTGEPYSIFGPIALADAYAAFGHLLDEHADDLMPYVKSTLEHGRDVAGHEYSQTLRRLERFRMEMAEFFREFDLLLTPATAVPAFPAGQRPREIDGQKVSPLWGAFPFTVAFNLTRQPAASVPCGFSPDGLPIGLQIVGRYGEEATVLRASAAFEKARPWADKVPPV
ncbi:MAG: amidase family protein [Chloroflexota bacterium]